MTYKIKAGDFCYLMKTMVKIENSISGKSLFMYVDSINKVNELMLNLMEAGFTVNYEPRYISGNYEGSFLCEDGNVIKICCKKVKEKE